ncbi:MAG: CHASE2 domain-containing protein, partial [Acidobacteriota bacterium]
MLCLALALFFGWSQPAAQLDGQAYDWMFSSQSRPGQNPSSVLLAIDEASLIEMGGARRLRETLGRVLPRICAAKPLALAVDLMLSTTDDPDADTALAKALSQCPSVVLGADILRDASGWEEPIALFRRSAAALGHVHAEPDPVSRQIALEKAIGPKRYWALALEAYRLSKQAGPILESPQDLEVGLLLVPAARATARSLYIRFLAQPVPQLSLRDIDKNPDRALEFSGKAVFVGYTDQSAARDRLMTPMGKLMTGVEIHANLYETLQSGNFLIDASPALAFGLTLAAVAASGAIFFFLSGATA